MTHTLSDDDDDGDDDDDDEQDEELDMRSSKGSIKRVDVLVYNGSLRRK